MTVAYGQNYLEYKPATKVPYRLPETKEVPTEEKSKVNVEPLFDLNFGQSPNKGLNLGGELGIRINKENEKTIVSDEIAVSLQKVNMQNDKVMEDIRYTPLPVTAFSGGISNKLIFKTKTKNPLENSVKASFGFIQNRGYGYEPLNDMLFGGEYSIKKHFITNPAGGHITFGAGVSGAYALGANKNIRTNLYDKRGSAGYVFPFIQGEVGSDIFNFNVKGGYNFTGSKKYPTNPEPYISPFGEKGFNMEAGVKVSIDKIYQAVTGQ